MANNPQGRTAPASLAVPAASKIRDPIALHGEAINACAMATYYTRKGNYAGAARKTVQALAALRSLGDGAGVCIGIRRQGGAV